MKKHLGKILNECLNNEPEVFHPVHNRGNNTWFPGNDAARILMTISNAWEDILALSKIRITLDTDYKKRLLFKYTLIELRSITEQIKKLHSIIFSTIKGNGKEIDQLGYITKEEKESLIKHFKNY